MPPLRTRLWIVTTPEAGPLCRRRPPERRRPAPAKVWDEPLAGVRRVWENVS